MTIDLTTEKTISPKQATPLFPPYRFGQPTHVSRVIRAITKGSRGPNGDIVRLEAVRLGGQWVTSIEAIQRYAERLTPTGQPVPEVSTPTSRSRAAEPRIVTSRRSEFDMQRPAVASRWTFHVSFVATYQGISEL